MSHGEHRLLELAMALASKPRLLLLDEPMAGLGPEESARVVTMLRGLKGSLGILLVEHDMEAVFALADRPTVFSYGRVIASGVPDVIRGDAEVRRAYVGSAATGGGRSGQWPTSSTSTVSRPATGAASVLFGLRPRSRPAKW